MRTTSCLMLVRELNAKALRGTVPADLGTIRIEIITMLRGYELVLEFMWVCRNNAANE